MINSSTVNFLLAIKRDVAKNLRQVTVFLNSLGPAPIATRLFCALMLFISYYEKQRLHPRRLPGG